MEPSSSDSPLLATSNALKRLPITHRHLIFGFVSFAFIVTLYNFLPALSYAYHDEPFTGKVPLWPTKAHPLPTVPADETDWIGRADEVKKAFQYAYHGYETYAAPMDNLRPLSNNGTQE